VANNEGALGQAATAIGSALGRRVRVFHVEQSLILSFSDYQEVNVVVAVMDPERPTFRVTYPRLQSHHRSLTDAREVDAENVLLAGVLWIVQSVAEHGVCLPEFVHPHVQQQLRRRRRG